ncbi:MAG TPA: hypothetical protein VJP77_08320, partial [Planctomycetota bacterium]|nr:hypothetical protein [Planctomycetota bacterium]
MRTTLPRALAALAATALPAAAQSFFPLAPFSHTRDLYVSDSGNDAILRLADLDLDGDFDAFQEVRVFYSDVLGPFPLGNNNGVTVGLNGVVYVSDSTEDRVIALLDRDGDGSCHGPNEAWVYFDGTGGSVSGIVMGSSANMSIDLNGNVWVSVSGSGSSAPANEDKVVRLVDLNGDGDAQDFGEAVEHWVAPAGSGGDSVPQDVLVGFDGRLYLVDVPSSGPNAKGVYRLDDADGSGAIDQPGEHAPFFVPPAQPNTPFYWGLGLDASGHFYLADTGNELVWRFRDADGDQTVDPLTEATVWWQAAGDSFLWRLAAASDGSVYAVETETPDRVLRLLDADGSGTVDPLDPAETQVAWSDVGALVDISNPRSLAMDRQPTLQANAAPQVGQPWDLLVLGTAGDIAVVYWSAATVAPIPFAPFGELELDVTPGLSGFLFQGVLPEAGPLSVALPVPADPGFAGATVALQGIAGK